MTTATENNPSTRASAGLFNSPAVAEELEKMKEQIESASQVLNKGEQERAQTHVISEVERLHSELLRIKSSLRKSLDEQSKLAEERRFQISELIKSRDELLQTKAALVKFEDSTKKMVFKTQPARSKPTFGCKHRSLVHQLYLRCTDGP